VWRRSSSARALPCPHLATARSPISPPSAFLPRDVPPQDSQNHRMVGVGRDLCGSHSPTLCPSRVTYSRLQRTTSRRVLSISREGDSTTSLGSLGQGSITLRVKKFFLIFSWNSLCFRLCPLPLDSRPVLPYQAKLSSCLCSYRRRRGEIRVFSFEIKQIIAQAFCKQIRVGRSESGW